MIRIIILEKGVDILKLLFIFYFYCETTFRGSSLKIPGTDFWESMSWEFSLAIELSYLLA